MLGPLVVSSPCQWKRGVVKARVEAAPSVSCRTMAVATQREFGLFIGGGLVEPASGEIRELSEPRTGGPPPAPAGPPAPQPRLVSAPARGGGGPARRGPRGGGGRGGEPRSRAKPTSTVRLR